MSYYTTIYPKDDFDLTVSDDIIEENCKLLEGDYNKSWEAIVGMCAASASTPDNVEKVNAAFHKYFNSFIEDYRDWLHYSMLRIMKHDAEYYKEDVPRIDYNHYQYNSRPEDGVEEIKDCIQGIKERLLIMANGNPKDLFPVKDTEETLYKFEDELKENKELIQGYMYDLVFSELCVKYWDTHEEG